MLSPGLLLAQVPRIGVIDFYGLNKVSEERLRAVLNAREGDRLPASKADLEDRLEQVPGVVLARLEAVCCEGERAILYVGIEEKGAPHFDFRYPPDANIALPEEIVEAYSNYLKAFEDAARRGETGENISQGYPLAVDPATRAFQERFRAFAEENVELLRQVLRTSMHGDQRAIAACVIGYAPRKRGVADDLLYAMKDADQTVRANAIRALGAVAVLAEREPDLGIRVSPTWFIEMLNSIVWNDRYRAAGALVQLTEKRDPRVLDHVRERALPALVQMARWKTLRHALPAYIVLGRVAGLAEDQIHAAWEKGEREKVIAQAAKLIHPGK